MKTLTAFLVSGMVVLSLACHHEDPVAVDDPDPTNEEIVLANVAIVRAAADAFASASAGRYPSNLNVGTTPQGETLVDLLPGGVLLVNPYTGARTEPRAGLAVDSGGVGYMQISIGGSPSSFLINGWGEEEEIALVDNIAELEAATIVNAELVVAAAESFAADNNGLFPQDIGTDQNLAGMDLIDYLPGGILITNAFTLAKTEPFDGASASFGQVGYLAVSYSGLGSGFTVTATGHEYQEIYFHTIPDEGN